MLRTAIWQWLGPLYWPTVGCTAKPTEDGTAGVLRVVNAHQDHQAALPWSPSSHHLLASLSRGTSVSVACCYPNKWPQTQWLKITQIYSLFWRSVDNGFASLTWWCHRGCVSSGGSKKISVPLPFPAPYRMPACLGSRSYIITNSASFVQLLLSLLSPSFLYKDPWGDLCFSKIISPSQHPSLSHTCEVLFAQ